MEKYGTVVEKWVEVESADAVDGSGIVVTVTNVELFGDNQVTLQTEFEQKDSQKEMKVLSYT